MKQTSAVTPRGIVLIDTPAASHKMTTDPERESSIAIDVTSTVARIEITAAATSAFDVAKTKLSPMTAWGLLNLGRLSRDVASISGLVAKRVPVVAAEPGPDTDP